MPMQIDSTIQPKDLSTSVTRLFELASKKVRLIEKTWDPSKGSPVFTVKGKYTSRGWTEWTQGFQYGSSILQFDATGERRFLDLGRTATVQRMAPHVSHFGVHDHGFNSVSTYGNLWRLMGEGRIPESPWERNFYELALKISGAVQAHRWTKTKDGGFIYSFNGPHSLFVDAIRSLRSLGLAHQLNHVLMGEGDRQISLLERLKQHATTTATYCVYYGDGRDTYDVPGRVAHESIFNVADGSYRCPNSQQGYSPFSTWTRGLAWAICGFTEQLEFVETLSDWELRLVGGRERLTGVLQNAATATADFYLAHSCRDGIPMWDTGAPNLHRLGDYLGKAADPLNDWEPVDSSAAAIAAQGLLRLGNYLKSKDSRSAEVYREAAFSICNTLLHEPYISSSPEH